MKTNDYIKIIVIILFISNIGIFIERQNEQINELKQSANLTKQELETNIQSGIKALKYLNISAHELLKNQKDTPLVYAQYIKDINDKNVFSSNDSYSKETKIEDKSSLSGIGNFRSKSILKEMDMTLLLTANYKILKEQNKDFAWIYYASKSDFLTLYPYISDKDYVFTLDTKELPYYSLSTPEKNPNKELIFTPLYVDGVGLGLMVSLAIPVYVDNKFLGVTALDITLKSQSKIIKSTNYLDSKVLVFNDHLDIIAMNNIKTQDYTKVTKATTVFDDEILQRNSSNIELIDNKYIYVSKFSNSPWTIVYYKDAIDVIATSFFYTLPIWLLILLLLNIKKLIGKLETSNIEIKSAHEHTNDSIRYASIIQKAILPQEGTIENYFSDSFVYWNPKAVIGGDIYFASELRKNEDILIMVIDCTGHGVPGAFVTMLVKAIERQIIADLENKNIEVDPSIILSTFNRTMKILLQQENKASLSNVGFDGQILHYNKNTNTVKVSSARNDVYYVEDSELKTIKADKKSVGYKDSDMNYSFKTHELKVKKGTKFYLSTDGYIDQNGGLKGFPFGKSKFKEILNNNHEKAFSIQCKIFEENLIEYQKDNDRNDDITIIGFEI